MRDRKLNKQEFDAIGKMLVVSDARRVVDIDAIVTNPQLFASVLARVTSVGTPEPVAPLFVFTGFRVAAFGAAAAVLLLVVGAFSLLDTAREPVAVNTIQILPQVADVARPVFPPQGTKSGKLSAGRANKDEFKFERAILKRTGTINRPRVNLEPDTDFLPVSYTGDPDEISGGGQVIRVEMKRSSLFAIGVDIPLENDDTVIKADLLIGRDGVTRALRVVD